jgi:formylmethanofuran dehydrogenase subunit E
MSASAPYGYLRDPDDKHKLVVDDVAAYIVREIFDLYKAGSGVISIVKHLNSQSVQTPTTHKLALGIKTRNDYNSMWAPGTIRQILRNEIYIGNLVQGKRTTISYKISKTKNVDKSDWARVDDTHESIIDTETWDAVQRRIASRSRPVEYTGKIHIFAQKVYCDECGAIFIRKNQQLKNGTYIEYLHCSGVKYGNRICSNKSALRFDELRNLVTEEINALIEKYANSDEVLSELRIDSHTECAIKSLESEREQLNEQIVKKQSYFKKLYEDNLTGRISDEQFDELNRGFKADIDALCSRIKVIESDLLKAVETQEVQVDKRQVLEKYSRIESLDRVTVDEFIERIEIGKLDKLENARNIAINLAV